MPEDSTAAWQVEMGDHTSLWCKTCCELSGGCSRFVRKGARCRTGGAQLSAASLALLPAALQSLQQAQEPRGPPSQSASAWPCITAGVREGQLKGRHGAAWQRMAAAALIYYTT